jgi:long-chain acyl-CoA synthetase
VVREVAQQVVVFPLLRWVCRPRRLEGAEWLEGLSGPVLLVANHTSHLDSVSVLAALPRRLRRRTRVAAAADYFFTRAWLGTFASLVLGAFPFHREGAVSASLATCGDLVDQGCSNLIFPEGTRSRDGGLAPFKPGIGLLARELGVPVVPVHLAGLHAVLPKGRRWPRPGPVRVSIGQPLRVAAELSNAEAAAQLEAAVRRLGAASDLHMR